MIAGSAIQFFLTHDDLKTEKITFAGADGSIPAILVRPKEEGLLPTVVLLHGYGSRKELVIPTALELGKAGFCVLIPDLRGHGDSRLPSDFGGKERLDIVQAISYLVSRADVDRTKVALMGSSFGAMNAIIAGGIDNRIKTVISSSSPANLSRWLGDQDWDGKERHSLIRHVPIEFDNREEQNWRSPVAYVDKIPSVLIFHGDSDEIVPVSNAYELYNHASNSSRLRIIRGAEHDLPREIILPEAIEWLSTHLEVEISKPTFPISAYGAILGMTIFYSGFGCFLAVISGTLHSYVPKKQTALKALDRELNIVWHIAGWGLGYLFLTVSILILMNEVEMRNTTLVSLIITKVLLGLAIGAYLVGNRQQVADSSRMDLKSQYGVDTRLAAHIFIICSSILTVWVLHAWLADFLFLPFSDLASVIIFPEIYLVIVVTAVLDEFWFRQIGQEWILESTGKLTSKQTIMVSSFFYLIVKITAIIALEFYFNLFSIRWLLVLVVILLFIGIVGAFLKKAQGLWASTTFSILVHSTIYGALTLAIFL